MSKHLTTQNSDNSFSEDGSPAKKKRKCEIEFEPIRLCSIGSVKELNDKVLRAQHYKLCERFRLGEKVKVALQQRIDDFERRQAQDDAILCIINRYWNRLDEDVQILLQRFDFESSVELVDKVDDSKHFLNELSEWNCEEADQKMQQRVEFSQRAHVKLLKAFDRQVDQNKRICSLINSSDDLDESSDGCSSPDSNSNKKPDKPDINEEIQKQATEMLQQNTNLQKLVGKLQAENHKITLKFSNYNDQISILKSKIDNITTELEDTKYKLGKSMSREEKFEYRLAEYVRKEKQAALANVPPVINNVQPVNGVLEEEVVNLTKSRLDELQQKLDDQITLSNSRLTEIQELNERNKMLTYELEKCKVNLKHIPSESIKNSSEYKSLQSTYSSLLDDSKALKREFDELKLQFEQYKKSTQEQFENMKQEETITLKRMEEVVLELENNLIMATSNNERLMMENQQLKAAKDHSAQLHEQIQTHMKSYNSQSAQMKKDITRFKHKWQESGTMLTACQKELENLRRITGDNYIVIRLDERVEKGNGISSNNSSDHQEPNCSGIFNDSNSAMDSPVDDKPTMVVKKETVDCIDKLPEATPGEGPSCVKQENNDPEQQSKEQIQQLTLERDKLKEKLRAMGKTDLKEKRRQMSDDIRRKMRQLEEQCERLKKELMGAKQEEDGLMAEMESTGNAFEDMQEQNQKLIDQLREKDEINLRLMSEGIRTSHTQKKMKEEKEMIEQKVTALENQLAAKTLLCEKLDEKDRTWNETRAHYENELRFRDQNNESLKRKAVEATQLASDLRLRLDRLTSQCNEIQESMAKKAASYEESAMKIKRLQEEKNSLKKKLERAKRMEKYENVDELLQEENRQLKESLTCPSCKVNAKNAILTKCFHVFCFDCLKTRYDNRRRKCPKCNAAFGANDYRRVYIE